MPVSIVNAQTTTTAVAAASEHLIYRARPLVSSIRMRRIGSRVMNYRIVKAAARQILE